MYKLAVRHGDAYYLPSGWVMGDICADEACIGLRLTVVADRDIQEKLGSDDRNSGCKYQVPAEHKEDRRSPEVK